MLETLALLLVVGIARNSVQLHSLIIKDNEHLQMITRVRSSGRCRILGNTDLLVKVKKCRISESRRCEHLPLSEYHDQQVIKSRWL